MSSSINLSALRRKRTLAWKRYENNRTDGNYALYKAAVQAMSDGEALAVGGTSKPVEFPPCPMSSSPKEPSKAEIVKVLRRAALNTERAASAARGNAVTGALYQDANECRAMADALESSLREQGGPSFEEKVDKAVVAVWGPYAEAAGMDFCRTMMRRVLKATGVEGD